MHLEPAGPRDLAAVAALMNRAYRGTVAGWNTEAGYIVGDRTNVALLAADREANPGAALLVSRGADDGGIAALVRLEPIGGGTWHLGSLTVDPARQQAGLGRLLLEASERWAAERGATRMRMTVVNVRDALIAWYQRRGYRLTGETAPFPYADGRFGTPTRDDLHFLVLDKALSGQRCIRIS